MNYELMMEKLESKQPISLSRWGDGEWECMLGFGGGNSEGCYYFPDLGKRLGDILVSRPPYWLGYGRLASSTYPTEIAEFMELYKLEDLNWSCADVFHDASADGSIGRFFKFLNERYVVIVGPKSHDKTCTIFKSQAIARIRRPNCWLEYPEILQACQGFLRQEPHAVIVICAGFAANVLIDDLYRDFGDTATLLDCGSLFEPYIGLRTRTCHDEVLERLKKEGYAVRKPAMLAEQREGSQ
jgi:hypothetical protein